MKTALFWAGVVLVAVLVLVGAVALSANARLKWALWQAKKKEQTRP